MDRFPPNRIAIAALALLALSVCVECAVATDISGTITSTLKISDDSQLVGDVTCAVPLSINNGKGVSACIAFGADDIKLALNGHTITGPIDPPTGCSLPTDSNFGVGISVIGNKNVKIEGPGVIQNFQRWGILLGTSMPPTNRVSVHKVTVNRNCWSGMQVSNSLENDFEENVWVNNAAGSNGAACGGICLFNSSKNRIHKSIFHGNGSLDYEGPSPVSTAGNVDFGIGFEGNSSENSVEENDIGGSTNGILFFNTSSDNVIRHNIIAGNPSAQVIKSFTIANQQGADIAFRASFTGTNNTIEDNFCLTYRQGGGPATAPCPNASTGGVEESANRRTSPARSQALSIDAKMAASIGKILSVVALVFVIAFRRLTLG